MYFWSLVVWCVYWLVVALWVVVGLWVWNWFWFGGLTLGL